MFGADEIWLTVPSQDIAAGAFVDVQLQFVPVPPAVGAMVLGIACLAALRARRRALAGRGRPAVRA